MVDFIFSLGIKFVTGPLISLQNFNRPNFLPKGAEILLDSIFQDFSIEISKKHKIKWIIYGNKDYIEALPEGKDFLYEYEKKFEELSRGSDNNSPRILLGIGYCTDIDTHFIVKESINFYRINNYYPTFNDFFIFCFKEIVPSIDIFIRTNEMRASGGLHPLLVNAGTQFYTPVSPGLISFSETVIRKIIWDYLFARVVSGGTHHHLPLSVNEENKILKFYTRNKDVVLGVGERIGDIWLPKLNVKYKKL